MNIDDFGNNYTHWEIHPAGFFGVNASVVPLSLPLPTNNPSPRNQSALEKQVMGNFATNYSKCLHFKKSFSISSP